MELKLIAAGQAQAKTLKVGDEVFGVGYNPALVHQVVTAQMSAARAGTKAQKTRAEVSGGGIKPWRQKGTGRARAGTTRSPIWRAGGVTFAAKPRSFKQKVNKKMFKAAMRSILSELVNQDRLAVVDSLTLKAPKTRELVQTLTALNMQDVLIITHEIDPNLHLAARNLYQVKICKPAEINAADLLGFEKVLITSPAVKQIEEWLG